MSREPEISADDAPLPAPIPGAEFKHLNRRQSIVAWAVGLVAGIGIAVGALLICAPQPL